MNSMRRSVSRRARAAEKEIEREKKSELESLWEHMQHAAWHYHKHKDEHALAYILQLENFSRQFART